MRRLSKACAQVLASLSMLVAIPAATNAQGVAKIAVGTSFACALTADGGVKCWGDNRSGALGDGTYTSRLTPADVPSLTSGVVDITAGDGHICALTNTGGVKCWGYNFEGQLGNGSGLNDLISVPTPGDVVGLTSGVRSVVAGYSNTCAVMLTGALRCWGSMDGLPTFPGYLPQVIPGLEGSVEQVATSGSKTCALVATGSVQCWGYRSTQAPLQRPTNVTGLSGAIATISTSCATSPIGTLKCWGDDLVAHDVATPTPIASISGGIVGTGIPGSVPASFRCYIDTSGAARCAGYNYGGLLGDGTNLDRSGWVSVSGLTSGVAQIYAAIFGTCAVTTSGEAYCWGENNFGEVGDGTLIERYTAQRVTGLATHEVAASPGSVSGLWWNPSESGWGVQLTHRRNVIFVTWYAYDAVGAPKWYVASNCAVRIAIDAYGTGCTGTLYEVNGPTFFGTTFDPTATHAATVGTLEIQGRGPDASNMIYTVNGQSRQVAIVREQFGEGATSSVNYTDLWWNPAQSGWGLAVTHQGPTMFLAMYVYDNSGKPMWYVASNCVVSGNGCTGTLYRTTGPAFGPTFDPTQVHVFTAGTVTLAFSDPNNGTLSYSVDGVSGTKAITRQLF